MVKSILWYLAILSAVALLDVAASAQTLASESSVLPYPAEFFASASPADAYEMLLRVPGFTVEEGDEEVRGFAGAAGNVLIDGKPPAGKQEGLITLLRRIPFAGVARIELIRGGASGIDMGGRSVIANIVRRTVARLQATIEAGASVGKGEALAPRMEAEAVRQWGKRRLELAASYIDEIDEDTGRGSIERTALNGTGSRSGRDVSERERVASGSGKYETDLAGGELVANASLKREVSRVRVLADDALVLERARLTSAESGALYRRAITPDTRLELLAVQRRGFLRSTETSREDGDEEAFHEQTDTGETIARASMRRERPGLTIEASVEGALNRLRSKARFLDDGALIAVPGSNARVAERRAEAELGLSWSAQKSLLIETSIAAETSVIESTGDSPQRNTFQFLKPRAALRYSLGKATQVRLIAEREIGQLDFADFVASASLEQDQVSAGAIDLRPSQTWRLSAALEHRFSGESAVVVTYSREWINDVVDRVLVESEGEFFDAVGNIGSGSRDVLKLEASTSLRPIGLPSARISGAATFRWGRVTDPITGHPRSLSDDDRIDGEVRFTHDLKAFTWGADLKLPERKKSFRFDEIRSEREDVRLSVHGEYRFAQTWRLGVVLSNLNRPRVLQHRVKYDGPRSRALITEVERRRTRGEPIMLVTLRRTLGAARP
jgi:hypothetical protein